MKFDILNLRQERPKNPVNPEEFEAIAELREPIQKILEQLRTKIETGAYQLVIGDDVSGRIPAIIIAEILKRIALKKGLSQPKLIFIPGGINNNNESKDKLSAHLKANGLTENGEILIVTEYIYHGDALRGVAGILRDLDYKFDIASIGTEREETRRRDRNIADARVISGAYERYSEDNIVAQHVPKIYFSKLLSGVKKRGGDLVSKRIKVEDLTDMVAPEKRDNLQQNINKSRIQAMKMADELVEWYSKENK